MDLQGIGAVSAAGVTLISIPVLLVIGRWQARTTLQAAQEAGRAGFAQAQATYSSALDAVNAQASAAHTQWRRGVQRGAYAAFLLADHQVRQATERLIREVDADPVALATHMGEVDSAKAALRTAYVAVDLEGPGDLAFTADAILTYAFQVADFDQREATMERAWHQLVQMTEGSWMTGGIDAVRRDRARTFMECLVRVQVAIANSPYTGDPRHDPEAMDDEMTELTSQVYAALSHVDDALSMRDRARLLDMHYRGRPRLQSDYRLWTAELEQARTEFVRAARAELGSTPNT
ncbi:hypothetical protein [Streptomyces sp. NBC_01500]|uniref:hypothetical protein n=1 Tax=Streptomyces sp. NBC_01500 TaxID=2903886 RepID=UPI002254AC67|nr:hypothetical protein [Streptomyces sp. NBC_01500]MCX4550612.1 hypothetical protein [Streptomyces sp. NBC_01500]